MAAGNVYVGLKSGVWDAGMVLAAIAGFALFAAFRRMGASAYTPLENNITQVTSASMASMPATAGVLGAIPGLALLGHHYPAWAIGAWGLALGVLGVLIALPLRKRLLDDERLPFPLGIATAEVIEAMHGVTGDALRRARALGLTGLVAAAWTWFRD